MQRAFRRNSVEKLSRSHRTRSGKIRTTRPRLDILEDRLLLAGDTLTWTGALSALWSDPGNWTTDGADTTPQNNDVLVFPAGASHLNMDNDISNLVISLQFTGGAYTISDKPFTLDTGGISLTSGPVVTINQDVLTSGDANITNAGYLAFEGTVFGTGSNYVYISGNGKTEWAQGSNFTQINVNSGTFEPFTSAGVGGPVRVASGATLSLYNGITISENVTLDGGTLQSRYGNNSLNNMLFVSLPSTLQVDSGTTLTDTGLIAGAPITLTGGGLFITGPTLATNTVFDLDNGTLAGFGSVGAVTSDPGTISPGAGLNSIGTLSVASLVTTGPGFVNYDADIASASGLSDTISASGTVDVSNLLLNLNLLPSAPGHPSEYTLIDHGGASPIIGLVTVNTDSGPQVVPDGGNFVLGGNTFVLRYTGGDGNDLVLQVFNPVAVNDTFSTPMNDGPNASNSLFGNVETNDTVPPGFAVAVVTSTTHGQLQIDTSGNGNFTYTPDPGFYGVDSFTYHLVMASQPNNIVSNDATVTIYVNNTSLAPKGLRDIFAFSQDAVPPDMGNVLTNDIANSGNSADLTAQLYSGPQNAQSFSLNSDGTFNYTPTPGFSGTDTFQYLAVETVIDPITGNPVIETSQPTQVTILIQAANVPPVAVDDLNYATYQNQTLSVQSPGVLVNDNDPTPGPNALTVYLTSQPAHGTVVLNADGSFTYTPDANYLSNGTPDTFTYVATDGANISNTATVAINVRAGLAPPIGVADIFAVDENGTLTGQNVLTNDIDLSGNTLTAQLVNGPTNASAFTFNADGTFTYTPSTNFVGVDSFSYRAYDATAGTFSDVTTVSIIVNAVNTPTAVDDNYATFANQNLSISAPGVLTNDTDTNPGATLSAILLSQPSHGTVTLNSDGSFTYIPVANYVSDGTPDTFTYAVTDGVNTSAAATVSINVLSITPVAVDDAFGTQQSTASTPNTLTITNAQLELNDVIASAAPTTLTVVNGPQHGTLTPIVGGYTYTPNLNYVGTDSFLYYLTTPDGVTSNPATVTITVSAVNQLVVAPDDFYTTHANQTLNISSPGVLGNDFDTNPDATLTVSLASAPAHGSVSLNSDGSFSYVPDANFNGTDTFTYVATDGVNTSAATSVTITVLPVAPIATGDSFGVLENTATNPSSVSFTSADVQRNDIIASGPVTVNVVNGPLHGSLLYDIATDTFTYTPDVNYVGTDSFTYYLSTAGGLTSGTATVSLDVAPVNEPITSPDDSYAIHANQTLSVSAPGVLANDIDTNPNATLTAVLVSQATNGTVSLNTDGSFTYIPNQGFVGTDTFQYTATDGTNTSTPTLVTINVLAVAPVTNPDSFSVLENVNPSLPSSSNVSFTSSDLELNDVIASGPVTVSVLNGPIHGTLSYNLATDTFTYTPNYQFVGTDSFQYYLTSAGGLTSNPSTVTLNVVAVNQPVTASDDFYAGHANQTITVSAPGVLGNDIDTNPGAILRAVLASQPTHGFVTLNSDGSFTYTPNRNYVGTDSFTYRATDGFVTSAATTVSINVLPTAPTAVDDSFTLNERTADADAGTTIPVPGVLANDTVPNNGVVSLNVVNSPIHGTLTLNPGGSFTYVPFTNYFGTDSFTYIINDGGLTSNVATVTLNIVARYKPVANSDSYSVNENSTLHVGAAGVLGNDTNVEGDKLQAVLVDGAKHGTIVLNSDGSFVYTPDANYSGPDTFTYKAVNGTLLLASDPVTNYITVNYVNVQPVANNDSYTIEQDSRLNVSAPGVLGNDTDPDGPKALTAVLVNTTQNGTLTLNSDGSFTYLPNPQFSGVDTFTYRAFDGDKSSNIATVTINVQYQSPTTVTLNPLSDTGISDTDHITRDNTPNFFGTTRPNLTVKLYVMPLGQTSVVSTAAVSQPVMTTVGTTTADSNGHFSVDTSVLPDGAYQVFAEAFRADGTSTGLVYGGPLVIDTVAPVVAGSMISPKSGQIYVTFQDNMTGMAQPTLNNAGNYSFYKIYRSTPRQFAITQASALPSSVPTAPQVVALNSVFGNRLPHGRYLFGALSGGIADVAGNALNGAFNGTFPTGYGRPGSNFLAQFNNDGYHNSTALPATQFVPIITNMQSSGSTSNPASDLFRNRPNGQGQGQILPAPITNGVTPGGPMANLKLQAAQRHRHR